MSVSMSRSFKERVTEKAAQWLINRKWKALGRMTTLSIDSPSRTIHLKLDLKGEPAPVEIAVRDYRILDEDGRVYLEFSEVETSREWINVLLRQYLARPRIEITRWAAFVKLLM